MADLTDKIVAEIEVTDHGTAATVQERIAAVYAALDKLTSGQAHSTAAAQSYAQALATLIVRTNDLEAATVKALAAEETSEAELDRLTKQSIALTNAKAALRREIMLESSAQSEANAAYQQQQVLNMRAGMVAANVPQFQAEIAERERLIQVQQANTQASFNEQRVRQGMLGVMAQYATMQEQLVLIGQTQIVVAQEEAAALLQEHVVRTQIAQDLARETALTAASTAAQRAHVDALGAKQVSQARNSAEQIKATAAHTAATASLNALDAAQARLIELQLSGTATATELALAEGKVTVAGQRAAIAMYEQSVAMDVASKSAMNFEQKLLVLHGSTVLNQRALGGLGIGLGSLAGASMPVVVGLTAIAAAMASAATNSMKWETEMVMLINNTTASDEVLQKLSSTMLQFGASIGGSNEQMAQGARIILDYGYTAEESINMLVETSKLAVATGADQAETAQAIAQAMHQYGAEASQTAEYIDTLYAASLRANTTLATFSSESKRATGIAAELGISYREVMSAISALTRVYGTVAEAQTQVLSIMRYLSAPTKEEAEAWDDLALRSGNYNLSAARLLDTIGESGLTGMLGQVKSAMDALGLSHTEQIQKTYELVNAQRGGQGLLLLLSEANSDYLEGLTAHADATAALARQTSTAQGAWDRMGNTWRKLTSEGEAFSGVMRTIGDALRVTIQLLASFVLGLESAARSFMMIVEVSAHVLDPALMSESVESWKHDLGELREQLTEVWNVEAPDDALGLEAAKEDAENYSKALAVVRYEIDETTGKAEKFITAIGGADDAEREAAIEAKKLADGIYTLTEATQIASDMVINGFSGIGNAIKEGGAEGGLAFVQELVTNISLAPLAVQQALAPLMPQLQAIVESLKLAGTDGGFGFSFNLHNGVQVNLDPIQTLLGQYDSAFDRRKLYATLGIETGDNFGQHVKDRVAAWYGPIKATLDAYLAAFELVANVMRAMSGTFIQAGIGALDPTIAAIGKQLETSSAYIDSYIKGKRDELAGLKADVDDAAASAIKAHDDKAGKKAPTGSDPGQMELNEQRKKNALETAMAALQELQAETRLRAMREDLEEATDRLNQISEEYDETLEDLTDTQEAFADASEEVIHALDVEMFNLETEMMQVEKIAENMLEPLIETAEKADDALQALEDESADVDHAFNEAMHGYEDLMNGLEDESNVITDAMRGITDETRAITARLRELETESRGVTARLRTLAEEEKVAMDAINAVVEASQRAVEAEQNNLDAVNEKYETLIGLRQKELDLLIAKDNQNKRDDELQGMAQEVGNLQARIANAVVGSREYNALIKERDRTAGDLDRKQKEFKLEDEIQALNDEKEVAVKAAQDKLKAAQQQLKMNQDIAKSLKENFDAQRDILQMEQEGINRRKEALELDQEAIDRRRERLELDQEEIDRRKEMYDREIEILNRNKERYDYEQGEKIRNAQADKDRADAAVEAQEKMNDAVKDAIQDQIDKRAELARMEDFWASERDRMFDKVIDQEEKKRDAILDTQQAVVDGLKGIFETEQDAQDAEKFANKYDKAIRTLTTAILAYGAPIGHAADKTKIYAENTQGVNEANKVLDDALRNQVGPAMQGFADKTLPAASGAQATFMKYFGSPEQGGDTEKSIGWYLNNRNPQGFYAKITTGADLGLGVDGFRGMVNNRMDDMDKDLIGKLQATATAASTESEKIGGSILDGITKGLGDTEKKNALAKALTDAVNDAIAAAETAIESGSPSEKTARLLGGPMIMGVGKGSLDKADEAGRMFSRAVVSVAGSPSSVAAYGAASSSAAASSVSVGVVNVTLAFPNVTKKSEIPTTRDEYARVGVAVNQGMAYDMARRGIRIRT